MFQTFRVTQPLTLTAVWVSFWMAGAHLFVRGNLVLDGPAWLALAWVGAVLLLGVSVALWFSVWVFTKCLVSDRAVPLVAMSACLGWIAGPGDELSGARVLVGLVAALGALGAARACPGRYARGGVRVPWVLLTIGALASLGWRLAPSDWDSWTLPVSSEAQDVIVIGVDGLDHDAFQRYREEGRLPTLAALAERGTMGPLRTFQPTSSPFIWNSIYTGYTPAIHKRRPRALVGPGRLLLERRGGEPIARGLAWLRPSEVRTPLDLWSIMRAAGYSTSALGTWEQGGPDPRNEVSLTEMAEYAPHWEEGERLIGSERSWALWAKPEYGVGLSAADRAPSELSDSLWSSILGEEASNLLSSASYTPEATFPQKRMARLRAITAADRMRTTLGVEVLRNCEKPCMTFVYLRGVDVLQHTYAHLLRGDSPGLGEEKLGGVIERYHTYLDGLISELLEAAPEDALVWVVSDHGLDLSQRPDGKRSASYNTGFHDFAPDGTWIAAGPNVGSMADLQAHVLDVAPTILSQIGLPTLADMEGRVIQEVTSPGQTIDHWIDRVPTLYDRGAPTLSSDQLDDQLKALGYVEE